MDFEEISQMLIAQPFEPFKFVLNDGSEHEVSNPEFCLLQDNDVVCVYHPSPKAAGLVSRPTRIVGVDITRIEPLTEQAA